MSSSPQHLLCRRLIPALADSPDAELMLYRMPLMTLLYRSAIPRANRSSCLIPTRPARPCGALRCAQRLHCLTSLRSPPSGGPSAVVPRG